MSEQEYLSTHFNSDWEYTGPKYSGFIYLDGQTIMQTLCKWGDIEDEYPCTTYGPMFENCLFS